MKSVVGIDIDDVILQTNFTLMNFHNKNYGTSYNQDEIHDFDLTKIWYCTNEEMHRRLYEFFNSNQHYEIKPVDGVRYAMRALHKKYSLFAITGRPESTRGVTKRLLERWNLRKYFQDIIFTGHDSSSDYESKGKACKNLSVAIFVEDAPHHAISIAEAEVNCLLYDNPWNRKIKPHPKIKRVYSWDEALIKIEHHFDRA